MADGLTTQTATLASIPGSTVIATDDAGASGHVQVVKLAISTDGSATAIPADATNGIDVDVTRLPALAAGTNNIGTVYVLPTTSTQTQQSSGLTTATTAYTAGDQLGALLTFTSMAASSGGGGRIVGAVLTDVADVIGAVDLFLFHSSVTLASDNAAGPGTSDADTRNLVGMISLPNATDVGGARVSVVDSLNIPYKCNATSLYVAMVTRSAHTFFGAATDLELRLFYELG